MNKFAKMLTYPGAELRWRNIHKNFWLVEDEALMETTIAQLVMKKDYCHDDSV
jgi:hypothetical protein